MLNITFDSVTGNPYYYISTEEQLKLFSEEVDRDDLFVGLYANETRFLTKNATLVKYTSDDIFETYDLLNINTTQIINNSVVFDLGNGHAFINFKCGSCDNGNEHQAVYDLESKVSMTYGYRSFKEPLEFYLSDSKACDVFSVLSNLMHDKSYRFINTARDCIGFLKDVSLKSGLENFADYFADYELIDNEIDSKAIDTKWIAFTQKHYNFPVCEVFNRKEVGLFMEETYGKDFRLNWDDLRDNIVNVSAIPKDSFMDYRIEDIKETFLNLFKSADIDDSKAKKLVEVLMNESIDNDDLYYYESINYQVDLIKYFSKFNFYPQIESKLLDKENLILGVCEDSSSLICKELLGGIEINTGSEIL